MEINIGKNTKRFRKSAGLTQEKLADKVDLSLRYIQNIEDGTRLPTIITLLKIAKALNKDIGDFFH
ncbi:MAG: helix-turn-helix transcriptional regulator [Candidatus Margulisbacteria bacterium]|jgi:putative transcriptional regulator|nr:helix-turn-helix transcriptional regulator [Candidatus Margulisiibacteriota bacterium]